VNALEDFDDVSLPEEGTRLPEKGPGWSKTLAWTALIVGGIYLLNPAFGVDLLPDNLPLVGNLDEVAVVLIVLGALHSLGIRLPEFIESWLQSQPPAELPATIDHEQG
jgi:hypothetical protein